MNVANLLTKAIERRGYGARSALADAVGVRPATVTKWLQGQTVPSPELRGPIEEHLGLEPGAIDACAEASGDGEVLPPLVVKAARDLNELDPADRRAVLDLIERLLRD